MVMKKLSITHDTRFRGRVQTLIAAAFPLTHPSGTDELIGSLIINNTSILGLNKSGQFNTKNTTSYESLEELKEDISKSKGVAQISDYKLYKNFWNLQNYLSNPFIVNIIIHSWGAAFNIKTTTTMIDLFQCEN